MKRRMQENQPLIKALSYEECHLALCNYQKETRRDPFFISGWDVDDQILLPYEIIEKTLPKMVQRINKYYLVEEDIGQTVISAYLKKHLALSVPCTQILIGGSATSLLCLLLLSLLSNTDMHALILEPSYFSVHDMFELLHKSPQQVRATFPEATYDYNTIESTIQNKQIKILIVTDPIFGSGIGLRADDYKNLTNLANRYKCILLVDMARMGMHWEIENEPLFGENLHLIKEAEQYAVVYSPCKKVFANGSKAGILVSSTDLMDCIKGFSDSILGSVSASQAEFLVNLMSESSETYISKLMSQNILLAKNRYEILQTITLGTSFKLLKPQMGHYVLASYPAKANTEREVFLKLLREANVYTLPMSLYGIKDKPSYSFRINLFSEIEELIEGIERIILTLKNSE